MGKIGRVAGVVVLLALVVVGCPAPVSLTDDAVRNYDTEPPIKPAGSGTPLSDDYDTTPQWNWTGAGGGLGYFRVRVNGTSWQEGVTSPWPNPTVDYYPGVYVFEVQERDAAGNWSEVLSVTTTIKVREPTFLSFPPAPPGVIVDQTPMFSWERAPAPYQYGATGRFSFQLERLAGSSWVRVAGESRTDTTATSYTVSSPLPDGRYRFGVAEWNDGGARSDFVYADFQVDTSLTPGILVSPTALHVVEGGGADQYSVVLGSPPSTGMSVAVTATSTGGQVFVGPQTLTFDDSNWNMAQSIQVGANEDAVVEGMHNDTITHTVATSDPVYSGLGSPPNVQVTIDDNDFEIVYNGNGETDGSAPGPITVTNSFSYPAAGNTGYLLKLGATFQGWNTAPDGSGLSYAENDPIPIPPSPQITLYAEWGPAFAGGTGTSGDPWQIATAEQLNNVRTQLGGEFIQTADIDLGVAPWNTGNGWDPIGTTGSEFSGGFDGNGFTVDGLFINSTNMYVGLFGRAGVDNDPAVFTNVFLTNVNVTGTGGLAGALLGLSVGVNGGAIVTNSGVVGGTVFSTQQAGGLVGAMSTTGEIRESFADVTVSTGAGDWAGGLVGRNLALVTDSYALGSVSGNDLVGGLVGRNQGSITTSYSAGAVTATAAAVGGLVGQSIGGTVAGSFYNSTTSGQTDVGKGEPKTTTEMTAASTFAGWNTQTVWQIQDGVTYPYHQWYTGVPPTPPTP